MLGIFGGRPDQGVPEANSHPCVAAQWAAGGRVLRPVLGDPRNPGRLWELADGGHRLRDTAALAWKRADARDQP